MKRYVKWWEVKQYIDNLVERLKTDVYFHLEECPGIFTFPRGGFILATLLSTSILYSNTHNDLNSINNDITELNHQYKDAKISNTPIDLAYIELCNKIVEINTDLYSLSILILDKNSKLYKDENIKNILVTLLPEVTNNLLIAHKRMSSKDLMYSYNEKVYYSCLSAKTYIEYFLNSTFQDGYNTSIMLKSDIIESGKGIEKAENLFENII